MSAQEELDRLTGCLALATGLPFQGRILGGAVVARSCTDVADSCVVTCAADTEAEAVAAFRAILRADTEAAVAEALAAERAKAAAAPEAARPSLAVYTVADREGGRSVWTRLGSAWTNKDGSITVRLDALPVSGILQIRDAASQPGGRP